MSCDSRGPWQRPHRTIGPHAGSGRMEEEEKGDAKRIRKKDEAWEKIHGIDRHEHQRFLNAAYVDFETNAEYARFMEIELGREVEKVGEEK